MAASLQWDEKYSVGIPEVDAQHKTLFHFIDRLDAAIRDKHGSAACHNILAELVDYTRIHFALEESLMRLSAYPRFEGHRRQHEELIAEVAELRRKLDSDSAPVSFELMHFLRVWLTSHILRSDQDYARHFQQSGFTDFSAWEAKARGASRNRPWWRFW